MTGVQTCALPISSRRERALATWIRRTSRPLDVLAFAFLASVFTRWLLDGRPAEQAVRTLASDIGIAVWIAFAIDYVVRLSLSVPRGAFIRTHKLDLLMVLLPFLRIVRVVIIIVRSVRQISTQRIAGSILGIAAAVVSVGALLEWRFESRADGASEPGGSAGVLAGNQEELVSSSSVTANRGKPTRAGDRRGS